MCLPFLSFALVGVGFVALRSRVVSQSRGSIPQTTNLNHQFRGLPASQGSLHFERAEDLHKVLDLKNCLAGPRFLGKDPSQKVFCQPEPGKRVVSEAKDGGREGNCVCGCVGV